MYHVSAQGVDERMINVHYYYYESRFNVSLIMRDKVTRQRPQTTIFEEKGQPKRIRTEVPLLTSLTPYRLTSSLTNHPSV